VAFPHGKAWTGAFFMWMVMFGSASTVGIRSGLVKASLGVPSGYGFWS